jgi:predicted O-linked N-acetylglucosamine transferase (SPINDLY family)
MFMELLAGAPDEPKLQYHLGLLSMELGNNQAAREHFLALVRLSPDFLEGRMLLGMICAELGYHEESIAYLREVLAICPDVPEVRYRVALSLAELNRHQEAYDEYQEVLRLEPDHGGVLCGLGMLFTSIGQISQARKHLTQAHERDPKALNIINNLAKVYRACRIEESIQWYELGMGIDPTHDIIVSNYLYALNCVPGLAPEFVSQRYRDCAPRAFPQPETSRIPVRLHRKTAEKLRIGYISADFYAHSVSYFLEPILRNHNHQHFEIYCYSNRTFCDEATERLKSLSDGWRTIFGISGVTVAQMIADDGIDILVDLSGHTAGRRLDVFVHRPAPVQVSWVGHPNTTGLPQMDYYLTDPWCDPPGMTDHLYSEQLYRLPRVFSCYQPVTDAPEVGPVPSLKSGAVTFGCFNQLKKINEELISWWTSILEQVPGSFMLIKSPNLNDPEIHQELLDCFIRQGIDPKRLTLRGVTETRQEHLALYDRIDIALDTYPYHGTTTTCEALWMGLPVITLAGQTHVSRVGVSFLHAVGLDELIARTPEEYIHKAVQLAGNPQLLAELRHSLRLMISQSPLMDAAGVTRELEDAYRFFAREYERSAH